MKQIVNRITCWYMVFYAVYSISTRFVPTALLFEGAAAGILYKSVVIGAGILALCYLLLARRIRLNKSDLLLAAFVLVLGVSTIANREYEFTENILGTGTFTAQLIVFYLIARMMPEAMIAACLRRIALFTSLFWTPGCFLSLYQYIINEHYVTRNPENRLIRQGIIDGRLFGLFSDPNFAAFTSLLIVLLLLFALRTVKRNCFSMKLFSVYGVVCIVVNLAYLVMSNSRTIYIAAVGTMLFFVLLTTCRRHLTEDGVNRKQMLSDFLKRAAATLAATAAVYAVLFFPIQGIGHLVVPDRGIDDMVREDVNLENISNNRSTIWKNYLTLYQDKPVFGFSIWSALPYAADRYPDSYLAKTRYVTHNGYLSLLVETGCAGFLVMGAFFTMTAITFFRRIQKKEAVGDCFLFFAVLTAAVLIFLLCFHDVFFTVNIETMLLFTAIGYIGNSLPTGNRPSPQ